MEWTTEYRLQMNEMAKWDEREWYRLNYFLQFMLWAAIPISCFIVMMILKGDAYSDLPSYMRIVIVATIVATMAGAFLLLKLSRWGVYLLVAAQHLPLIGVLFVSGCTSLSVIGIGARCAMGILFIGGSLLMTNKCNINAYDLLWPNNDSIRPTSFLEDYSKILKHNE